MNIRNLARNNMELEQIEQRIKIPEPKIQKWKWIVGTVASAIIMLVGGLLMGLSAINGFNYTLFYSGLVIDVLGFIYLIVNIHFLTKVNTYKKEYDELIKQKNNILNEDSVLEKEKQRTLLLKLLEENKITKEEFDELVK